MQVKRIKALDPAANIIMDLNYTRDNEGNILTKTCHSEGAPATEESSPSVSSYTYDKTYQLLKTIYPDNKSEEFSYDPAGNREKMSLSGLTGQSSPEETIYSHNANNEMLTAGSTSFEFDANGSMTRKTEGSNVFEYVYNVENRLEKVKLNGNLIASYFYDPFGRRLWKDVSGVKTYFFYSDEGLTAEADNSGILVKTYGYQPDSIWTTNPLFTSENGKYYFYQNDQLFTPPKIISSNGAVVWDSNYETFGKATIGISSVKNNLRFPGQYFDEETGEHYNFQRMYMPVLGRYSQNDPLGQFESNDYNLYSYAENSPLNMFDNYGLFGDGNKRRQSEGKKPKKWQGHSDFSGGTGCGFDFTAIDHNKYTEPFRAPYFHFRDTPVIEAEIKAITEGGGKLNCNKDWFSDLMHMGQDSFSHKNGWGINPIIHFLLGTLPDHDTGAWGDAEEWSRRMIKNYWNTNCCEKCPIKD